MSDVTTLARPDTRDMLAVHQVFREHLSHRFEPGVCRSVDLGHRCIPSCRSLRCTMA